MLTLLSAATSPFARKVRIALAEKKIEYELVETSPWDAQSPVHAANPLSKVPTLTLDDGTQLFDSRVIAEYIDSVSPVSRLIPEPTRQRIAVRRWEALADGICDALVLITQEGKRPAAKRSAEWIARQRQKIDAGVAEMASELADRAWCNGDAYTLADIATGCALRYLDLRLAEFDWRDRYPNLAKHSEKLGKRPAFVETGEAPPVTR
ncbi:MAG: glutathione S-transferase N-terminal domain-containing protein [Casimicrobiaceae bacterium]